MGSLGSYVPMKGHGKNFVFNPKSDEVSCVTQSLGAFLYIQENPQLMEGHHIMETGKKEINDATKTPQQLSNLGLKFDEEKLMYTHDELENLEIENDIRIFMYSVTDTIINPEEVKQGKKEITRRSIGVSRVSKRKTGKNVYLVLLEDKHVGLITHFEDFIHCAVRIGRYFRKPHRCPSCLHGTRTAVELLDHIKRDCLGGIAIRLPPPSTYKEFKSVCHAHPSRYISYYDFECTQRVSENEENALAEHKAAMFNYVILDRKRNIVAQKLYTGPGAVDIFVESLLRDWASIRKSEEKHLRVDMNSDERRSYINAKSCTVCNTSPIHS